MSRYAAGAQVRGAPADVQKVGHLVIFSRACAALLLWLFAVPALAGVITLDAGTRKQFDQVYEAILESPAATQLPPPVAT